MQIITKQIRTSAKTASQALASARVAVDDLTLLCSTGTVSIFATGAFSATHAYTNGFLLKAGDAPVTFKTPIDLRSISFMAASNSNVLTLMAFNYGR
jgi:hypothetical protein